MTGMPRTKTRRRNQSNQTMRCCNVSSDSDEWTHGMIFRKGHPVAYVWAHVESYDEMVTDIASQTTPTTTWYPWHPLHPTRTFRQASHWIFCDSKMSRRSVSWHHGMSGVSWCLHLQQSQCATRTGSVPECHWPTAPFDQATIVGKEQDWKPMCAARRKQMPCQGRRHHNTSTAHRSHLCPACQLRCDQGPPFWEWGLQLWSDVAGPNQGEFEEETHRMDPSPPFPISAPV